MIALFLAACGNKKVAIDEAVSVDFQGLDTRGTAQVHIQSGALVNDVIKLNKMDDTMSNEMMLDRLVSDIEATIDKKENLTNGEEVTVTFTSSDDANKYYKIPKELKFTVKGLTEVTKITADTLKEKTKLEVSGFNKEGKAEVVVDDSNLRSYHLTIENDGKLENGKEAQITINRNSIQSMESAGYLFEGDNTFTLPVTGLKEVAETFDAIKNKDEVLAKLEEEIHKKYDDVTIGKKYYRGYADNLTPSYNIFPDPKDKNGTLVSVLEVRGFLTTYYVFGLYDLIIDKEGKVDVRNASLIEKSYESIGKAEVYLESIGYKEVK